MRIRFSSVCTLSTLVLLAVPTFLAPAASAATPEADQTFKHWSVFTIVQDGEKVCYITSSPTDQKGSYKRRGEPYFLVTYRGNGVSEISASSGYPFKEGSGVSLKVDSIYSTDLFTTNETPRIGWAKTSEDDKAVLAAMKKGNNMVVRGESRLGTYSQDTYSLMGLSKAYERMVSLCK